MKISNIGRTTVVKWLKKPFFWLVVVPNILGTLFFGVIASSMYVSEAQLTVRTNKGLSSTDSSGNILGAVSSLMTTGSSDSFVVTEYIRSPDILRKLDAELGIREHYSRSSADAITRLSKQATDEELLKYYRSIVNSSLDQTTGITKFSVRAYDPTFAHRLAQKIIKFSEDLVNEMSERAVKDTLAIAQTEVDRSEARFNAARIKLKEFRLQHSDFNPSASSTSTLTMVAGLEGDLAKASTELTQLRSFMREDSPQVVTAKSKVDALARQIAAEQARLTGVGDNGKSDMVLEYERLAMEVDFSQKMLDVAMRNMEQIRINAESKTRYLEAFVKPNLPEEALYPERLLCIGLTVLISLVGYGIIALSWAAIKEHTGV